MSEAPPSEIIIKGLTHAGKKFRPSDWAERLAGVFACFGADQRLCYSPYIRPLAINDIPCVEVQPKLQEIDPMAFNFLMNFARDNDLQVETPTEEKAR